MRDVNTNLWQESPSVDGIDRKGMLRCMARVGTGLIWAVRGGVATSRVFSRQVEINPVRRTVAFLSLVSALALTGLMTAANRDAHAASADQEQGQVKTERGGWQVTTPRHRFEVFFYNTGLRIFPSSDSGTAVTISKLTGSAAFVLPGAPTPLVYPLKGGQPIRGREPESLDLATDLSWMPVGETKVELTIEGLADPSEPRVSFSVPFEPVKLRVPRQSAETAVTPSPTTPAPSAPRYVYQAGYYGYGYYPATSPATTPVATAPAGIQYSVAPAQEVPLERPWLSPGIPIEERLRLLLESQNTATYGSGTGQPVDEILGGEAASRGPFDRPPNR
jgi:hypothetical protein